jgi:diguanylate cyclase (GGDEF)-like protein
MGRVNGALEAGFDWLKDRLPWLDLVDQKVRRLAFGKTAEALEACSNFCFAKTAVLTLLLFALIFAVDVLTGQLVSFRLVYAMPIWLAARLAGGGAGFFAMLVAGMLLSFTDPLYSTGTETSPVMTFAVRWIVLGGFLISVIHLENALQNARRQATHDPLTGLMNRAALEPWAEAAIAHNDGKHPFLVAVLDCDDFKDLNDKNGHSFGDFALRMLARKLEGAFRGSGKIGRLGGDEFVVMFQGTETSEARLMLEKANQGFKKHLAALGSPVSISYGLAALGEDGHTFDQLLRVADERMYYRKRCRGAGAVVQMPEARANVA